MLRIMLFLFLPVILTACHNAFDASTASAEAETTPAYCKLTPQEAQSMMTEAVIILDVRTPEEFDEGHIPNAVLLPDYAIREKAESVIVDKDQTVLVYCRTGRRSEAAAKALIDMGYTKIFDFGGIVDWTGEITT